MPVHPFSSDAATSFPLPPPPLNRDKGKGVLVDHGSPVQDWPDYLGPKSDLKGKQAEVQPISLDPHNVGWDGSVGLGLIPAAQAHGWLIEPNPSPPPQQREIVLGLPASHVSRPTHNLAFSRHAGPRNGFQSMFVSGAGGILSHGPVFPDPFGPGPSN